MPKRKTRRASPRDKKSQREIATPEIVIGKPKRGRPSSYRAEFCDTVIELGRKGKSKAQMAAFLDISRQMLDNWTKQFSEFLDLDAVTRAQDYALAWWEEVGHTGMFMGHRFNDRAWSVQVRNRFPSEYKEIRELGVRGAAGSVPIQIVVNADEANV
jgi:hypothetical protein